MKYFKLAARAASVAGMGLLGMCVGALFWQPSRPTGNGDGGHSVLRPQQGDGMPGKVVYGVPIPAPNEGSLRLSVRTNPKAAMALLFHELDPDDCLRLLPAAISELAQHDDSVIIEALAQVRTKTELTQAWSLVVSARLARDPVSAVALAMEAPPLAGAASTFAKDAVEMHGVGVLERLLSKGMPIKWAATGLRNASIPSAMTVFDSLNKALGGKWSAAQSLEFLSHLPKSAEDAREVIGHIMSVGAFGAGTRAMYSQMAKEMAKENPEHLGIIVSQIPEGYLKRSLVNAAAKGATDKETLAAAGITPESATGVLEPVQQAAMLKVIRTRDGGKEALNWALGIADVAERNAALLTVMETTGRHFGPIQPLILLAASDQIPNRNESMDGAVKLALEQLNGRELSPDEIEKLRGVSAAGAGALEAALARANASAILEKLK